LFGISSCHHDSDEVIFLPLRVLLKRRSFTRITSKGQVTIPQHISEKLGLTPHSEVEFVEEGDRVFLLKKIGPESSPRKFRALRGAATVKMTTDEIMQLTRASK